MTDIFNKAKLKCPVCGAEMMLEGERMLYCNGEKKHTYDISASGYINLASPKQCGGGDTKGAVRARSEFLDKGYYLPIAQRITELLDRYAGNDIAVIDAGCGEGYYTTQIAKNVRLALGFDISKFAVEAAAKRARREAIQNVAFGVASVYTLPVFDKSSDAVVNIFAPCVEEEYCRVLKDGGIILVAHAGKEHLMGLKRILYDSAYENDTRADLPSSLELISEENIKYSIEVTGENDIKALFAMTPYYWRTSQDDAKRLDGLERLETDVDIIFSVYRKR